MRPPGAVAGPRRRPPAEFHLQYPRAIRRQDRMNESVPVNRNDAPVAGGTRPVPWKIAPAVRALAAKGVIAYPTEAVYGLGCVPEYRPVMRLLRIKRRSARKGLILVAASATQLEEYIFYPDSRSRDQVLATWPGPVTWLLPARTRVPAWLRGEHPTLAVRVTAHPLVRALCEQAGPLISTSANPATAAPARDAARVRAYFGRQLDGLLVGPLGDRTRPTEIRDAFSGRVIRPGG